MRENFTIALFQDMNIYAQQDTMPMKIMEIAPQFLSSSVKTCLSSLLYHTSAKISTIILPPKCFAQKLLKNLSI